MDIIEFVHKHERAYRHQFMRQTLGCRLKSEELLFHAHRDGDDDPDGRFAKSEIRFAFIEPDSASVWGTNILRRITANRFEATILVDPKILDMDLPLRKMVLAEEWLEVMVGIAEPHTRLSKRTAERNSLIELYSKLGRPAHWVDDPDEQSEMLVGLQHLLLSDRDIHEIIVDRYGTTVEKIQADTNNPAKANEIGDLIRSIERSLAAEHFLKMDLVRVRLTQVIFSAGTGK